MKARNVIFLINAMPPKPWPNGCNMLVQHCATLAFGRHVAQCCVRLANPARHVATWSNNVARNMLESFGHGFVLVPGSMGQWWRVTSRFDVALCFLNLPSVTLLLPASNNPRSTEQMSSVGAQAAAKALVLVRVWARRKWAARELDTKP